MARLRLVLAVPGQKLGAQVCLAELSFATDIDRKPLDLQVTTTVFVRIAQAALKGLLLILVLGDRPFRRPPR